jgi:hypothetical protein
MTDNDGLISIGDFVAQEGFKKKKPRRKRAPKGWISKTSEIKPKRIIRLPATDIDWELNEGENLERVEEAIGVLAGFPFVEVIEHEIVGHCSCGRKILGHTQMRHSCSSCSKPINLRTTTEQHAVQIVRATAEQQREWEKLGKREKMDRRPKRRPEQEEERLENEQHYLLD